MCLVMRRRATMWQRREVTTPRPTGGHRREEAKVVGATTFDYPAVGVKDKTPGSLECLRVDSCPTLPALS